jgi:hypothetical protein
MTDSDSILLAEASHVCPACDRDFRELSRHWAHVAEHRPPIASHQHELLAGLVLGGATIYTQTVNPVCQFRTQYRDFAVWVTEELGWLVRSLRRVPTPSDATTAMQSYQVRTFPHPALNRYADWLTAESVPARSTLALSDRTVRAWYAKAAFVAWSTTHNTRETGFSAKREPKRTWVGTLLRRLDLSPSYRRYSWFCSPNDSRVLLDRVGGPVPGVEHKWSFDQDEYAAIRQEQHAARAWLADHPERERTVSIECYVPGEYEPATATEWDVETVYGPPGRQFSDGDCLDALQAVSDALDEPTTVPAYDRVRDQVPSLPSSSLIQQRFGTWATALTAAGID